VAAAIAIKNWLAETGKGANPRHGTPAEEGGGGKVYMVRGPVQRRRRSLHPGDANSVAQERTANTSAKFRFRGQSAHAAVA
jgi:aminobenzoyl-glutamate utilization protein B